MGQALPFKPVRPMGDARFDTGYGGGQDLPWVTSLGPMESGQNLRRRFEVIGSVQATRQNVMTRSWFTVQGSQAIAESSQFTVHSSQKEQANLSNPSVNSEPSTVNC